MLYQMEKYLQKIQYKILLWRKKVKTLLDQFH